MQTIEYHTIDKSDWGDGPWQSEPDKRQWMTSAGLPAIVNRNPSLGGWCGYVAVPKGHPAYDCDSDTLDVSVHGGLTFGPSPCSLGDEATSICHKPDDGESDDVRWFGFDCLHAFDLMPGSASIMRKVHATIPPSHIEREYEMREVYRDLAYVTAECEKLAEQLKAMSV